MAIVQYVEDTEDDDGYIVPGYSFWSCPECDREVQRYRGMSEVQCSCGAWFNACGQRIRDDWAGNPSRRDDEIGDLEGYERQHADDY